MYHKFFNTKPLQHMLKISFFKVNKPSQFGSCNLPNIKMKIIPAPPIKLATYIAKNEALKRTLSPHLSVYKPQISSIMSISVRMTGLALGIMAWVVALTELISDQSVDYYVDELKSLEIDDCYWTAAKTVIVFPFAFHFVAGIRHLLFDTAKLLEKPQFYATGYVAICVALILACCLGNMEEIRQKWDEMNTPKE